MISKRGAFDEETRRKPLAFAIATPPFQFTRALPVLDSATNFRLMP